MKRFISYIIYSNFGLLTPKILSNHSEKRFANLFVITVVKCGEHYSIHSMSTSQQTNLYILFFYSFFYIRFVSFQKKVVTEIIGSQRHQILPYQFSSRFSLPKKTTLVSQRAPCHFPKRPRLVISRYLFIIWK